MPRARHLRRPVHREHDGGGARLPRARAASATASSPPTETEAKREAAEAAGATAVGIAHGGTDGAHVPRPAGAPQRRRRDRRDGRLDERRPAPARDGTRGRGRPHAGRAGAVGERDARAREPLPLGPPPGRDLPPGRRHATLMRELIAGGYVDGAAPTVTGATLAEADAGAPAPDGDVLFPVDRAVQGDGRAVRPARQPRARGQPREGLRGRRGAASRGPARVFDGEEACADGRALGRACRRATCSSCATRARPADPGCARCSASPRRSSAPGSATRSRSSPTAASPARRAG